MFFVVGDISLEFSVPEFFVGFRHAGEFTAFVTVPEAAIDENDGFVFSEDDVGFSRQFLPMQAEPVSGAMEQGADKQFGLGVLAFDPAHDPASLFWGNGVHGTTL